MRCSTILVALGATALLVSCGQQRGERASGGAAAGAATGAGIGALAGPPGMAIGAAVGAGAGAGTGAATKPSEVNLGKPPWTNPHTRVPTPEGPVGTSQSETTNQLNAQSLQSARQGQNAQ